MPRYAIEPDGPYWKVLRDGDVVMTALDSRRIAERWIEDRDGTSVRKRMASVAGAPKTKLDPELRVEVERVSQQTAMDVVMERPL